MAWSRSDTSQTLLKLLRSQWGRAAVVGLAVTGASRPVAVATRKPWVLFQLRERCRKPAT